MTPEERAELERQLAAELDDIAIDSDDDDDQEGIDGDGYVRLDLEQLLSTTAQGTEQQVHTSWSVLLASVAQCDTLVFQAIASEMHELQTDILPAITIAAQAASSEAKERASAMPTTEPPLSLMIQDTSNLLERDLSLPSSGPAMNSIEVPRHSHDAYTTIGIIHVEATRTDEMELPATGYDERIVGGSPSEAVRDEAKEEPSSMIGESLQVLGEQSAHVHFDDAGHSTVAQVTARSAVIPSPVVEAPPSPVAPVSFHSQREAMFTKAQEEMQVWLSSEQQRWEAEHTQQEQLRAEAARELETRRCMHLEEVATRVVVARRRQLGELLAMQTEDQLAEKVEALLAREALRARQEQQFMAVEEARVWRRLRLERERHRQEKLVEEASRIRRYHHSVMEEIVARVETKRRTEDLERRRAIRECSEMRREEHWMRRVIAERRGLDEIAERRLMEAEERFERSRLIAEEMEMRRGRERMETGLLGAEDERSRLWETLGRLRVKSMSKCTCSRRRRQLVGGLSRWQATVAQLKLDELERKRGDAIQRRHRHAVDRIQRCVLRYTMRKREEENHSDKLAAARVVQSAYRGFHVRRKFQNALELAKNMGGGFEEDDGEYGEVNLEDLIEAPPELDDDWERPTITQLRRPETTESEREDEPECDEDDADDEEEDVEPHDARADVYVLPVIDRVAPVVVPMQQPEKEPANLAAQLWNRMRKKKQKQDHALEERKKELDPTYRVKKLLMKASRSSTPANNQYADATSSTQQHQPAPPPTVTWSTTTDKKKAPKVNVPSLVERLRKKTAAAR